MSNEERYIHSHQYPELFGALIKGNSETLKPTLTLEGSDLLVLS